MFDNVGQSVPWPKANLIKFIQKYFSQKCQFPWHLLRQFSFRTSLPSENNCVNIFLMFLENHITGKLLNGYIPNSLCSHSRKIMEIPLTKNFQLRFFDHLVTIQCQITGSIPIPHRRWIFACKKIWVWLLFNSFLNGLVSDSFFIHCSSLTMAGLEISNDWIRAWVLWCPLPTVPPPLSF